MSGKVLAVFLATLCCVLMVYQASAEIAPQCLLPLARGACRSYIQRYGFNPETNKCELFIYGGCGGNANHFDTLEECQKTCS
ncbi:unnamed protein product [Xylocopa violacea]|uniref:BPTI/Kunitz inhibitor domain-containing protein n=1 Tax=Xylocopa violacea TaxID=135666 RepID=A0ABP1NZI0_XYLVO